MNVKLNPRLLDIVELNGIDLWPSRIPRITGTVVEIFGEPTRTALIEISDENGVPREFVTRPIELLKAAWTAPESATTEVERGEPQGSFEKGVLLLQNGLLAEAKPHFARAFALEPRLAASLMNSTNLLAQRGAFDAAVLVYELILELQPKHALARENLAITHLNRGVQYTRLRAIDKAIDDFNLALVLAPSANVVELARQNLVAGYTQLGILHSEIRRYVEALAYFVIAFGLNPSEVTRRNLALAFVSSSAATMDASIHFSSETVFRKPMQMGLTLSECLNAYGVTLACLGQLAGATRALEAAIEADPGNELARKNLSLVSARPAPVDTSVFTVGLTALEAQTLQQVEL